MTTETTYVQVGDKKRKATAEEIAQFEKDQAEFAEQARLIEAEQTKKDADRASAMAKLSKLGLTDDEIASLIP
jgi:septal ring factor EnvC (AmiA/AmiB activator)